MIDVLSESNPICLGYSINEYGKILVVFDNLYLQKFANHPPETNLFQFIALKYFTDIYELIAIGGNPPLSNKNELLSQINQECSCK